jgi:predicted flap endonuclease-1-like 5' DNA nuclease
VFYLIQHLWLCLLLAAMLGALLMWVLRHWLMTDKVGEVQAAWQMRWNGLEREHLQVSKELQDALRRTSLIPGLEADLAKLQTNYQTLSDRHIALDADWKRKYDALEKDWRGKFTTVAKERADLHGQLQTSMQERDTLTVSLAEGERRRAALEAKYKLAEERLGGDIERIEGVDQVFGQRLRAVGIAWVVDLLDQCSSPEGRAQVAEKTGFTPEQLLTWTNMADLLRIPGVTPDWAELLHAAGVDTVKELKQRIPENLHSKMVEVNAVAAQKITTTVPDIATVDDWVERAKTMEFRVAH